MHRDEYVKVKHVTISSTPPLKAGDKVGRLTVICQTSYKGKSKKTRKTWVVQCECGTVKEVLDQSLRSNMTVSCGCLAKEYLGLTLRARKSKKKQTKTYMAWRDMLQRTRNKNNAYYKHYGGRGIGVCDSWLSFDAFYADMGDPPTPKHTLERNDNNKGYSPENCSWEVMKVQGRNKRTNRLVEIGGVTKCAGQWIDETGINESLFRGRLRKGLTGEALLAPSQRKRHA